MESRVPAAGPQRRRGDLAWSAPGRLALWVLMLLAQAPSCGSGPAPPPAPRTTRDPLAPSPAELPGWVEQGEYELVSPFEVDAQGALVSQEAWSPRRWRRGAQSGPGSEALHLRLQAFSQDLHLELERSPRLLAPGFMVQTLGRAASSLRALQPGELCFYQGVLRAHSKSSVALSTCQGLLGMIRTPEADYFLKPLPFHLSGRLEHRVGGHTPSHILYKRSAAPQAPVRGGQEGPEELLPQPESLHLQPPQKQHFCGRRRKYAPQPPPRDLFVLPDEFRPASRPRRSPLQPPGKEELNVEALVVVDPAMVRSHGRENITTYVLTILNMVSALFKDGTIGGNINIAIVGMILLEEEQPGLVISHHADHTLSSFCRWQSSLLGKDGHRHDHAILLTGLDICSWKNEPCDTLGLAPISGMCSKYRSCTVNEDTGLGLAFTIAHESGHNFGMVHDGEGNVCKKSEGNIMSPTLAGRNGVFSWSPCSRRYLHQFLSTAQALCLSDQPQPGQEYKYPEKLPGELYDASTQCKWQFGEKAKVCMLGVKKDICKALWCHRVGRKCETKFLPAAEGTACGQGKWCRGGQCVAHGDSGPKPTHGHWTDWSPWSPCSRTCGGGVCHRERQCTNPKPAHGGQFCEGRAQGRRLCNTASCPPGSPDFRALQCSEHNQRRFRGRLYSWRPYTQVHGQDVCKLYCIAEGFDFFLSLSNKVRDGTPCSEGSRDVCVDGRCERVGCDNVLGSEAVEDACGICQGNNSACTVHRGLYAKQHRSRKNQHLVTLPAGARSIRVWQLNASACSLSVRSVQGRRYLGDRKLDLPGVHSFAGTTFLYRPGALSSPGPTNETLLVELLPQQRNPGVAWEFWLPRLQEKSLPSFSWALLSSQCSASCGQGKMTTRALCYRDRRVPVNASFCSPEARPITGAVACKVAACPPSWSLGNWSSCSRTCGGGTQSRPVWCLREAQRVPPSLCPQRPPPSRQACRTQGCPPAWTTGPWAECSRSCGKGWRKRLVACGGTDPRGGVQLLPEASCLALPRPRTHEACLLSHCAKHRTLQWLLTAWAQCSVTCGRGTQRRLLSCVERLPSGKYQELAPRKCLHLPRPSLQLQRPCAPAPCLLRPQPGAPSRAAWTTSPWSQCSASCGGGVQTRAVRCELRGPPASGCPLPQKPVASQACSTHFCPITQSKGASCQDHFPWCLMAPQLGLCLHHFYSQQCCHTCSRSSV